MSQAQKSREELLLEWKLRKQQQQVAGNGMGAGAGRAVGGPLSSNNTDSRLLPAGAAKPAPGLPPRLAKAPVLDKENGGIGPAGGFGAAVSGRALQAAPAPDSVRKAFANGQQQQEMLQEFDALQGRLQALKRESVRPSISGAGGAAAVSRGTAVVQSASSRPAPDLALAGARATQPAAAVTTTRPPLAAVARPQPQQQPQAQQYGEPQAAAAQPAASAQVAGQPPAPTAPAPLPPGVAAARGAGSGSGSMELDDGPVGAGTGLPFASSVGGLAARLESLKRESVRPSMAGGQSMAGVVFEAAAPIDAQALTRLAIQLFDDEQFRQLCDRGMNAQLTRSKDGATGAWSLGWMGKQLAASWQEAAVFHACCSAVMSVQCCRETFLSGQDNDPFWAVGAGCLLLFLVGCLPLPLQIEIDTTACPLHASPSIHPSITLTILAAAETKIQELAGIVKLLRRGMKELQTKANEFIAAACKFEKEVGQQVGLGSRECLRAIAQCSSQLLHKSACGGRVKCWANCAVLSRGLAVASAGQRIVAHICQRCWGGTPTGTSLLGSEELPTGPWC